MGDSKTKKPGALVSASQVLQSLLGNGKSPLSDQFIRWKLWRYWESVVGVSVASHSRPVELSHGRLLIWVKSSSQMNDMHFLSETIRENVNKFLGSSQVKQVRFTIDQGRLPAPDSLPTDFEL